MKAEQWNSDSGTVWWNSVGGTVWLNSAKVMVEQCWWNSVVKQCDSEGGRVEKRGKTVEQ